MLDFEVLRILWWLLLGIVLIGFMVTDGFDFGAAILLPLVTKNDLERRAVLAAIGPFWEGNQVWIILGAGAIFAAWPFVYAVAFSGFYFLLLLLLLTMGISRPVSFKYRSKLPNDGWRRFWDRIVVIGGLVPAFIFGALLGNALLGAPFYFDATLRMFYTGSFAQLFSPFAILTGLLSICMLVTHGGLYLGLKTEDAIRNRALNYARLTSLLVIILFLIGGYLVATQLPGYTVVSGADHFGFSNPLHKQVIMSQGAWLNNFRLYPSLLVVPTLAIGCALLVALLAQWQTGLAFICNAVSMAGILGTAGISMFPFILPSSTDPRSSLLVWDASSSQLTLMIMLVAALIFVPIILLYTSWVYRVLRGTVELKKLEAEKNAY